MLQKQTPVGMPWFFIRPYTLVRISFVERDKQGQTLCVGIKYVVSYGYG